VGEIPERAILGVAVPEGEIPVRAMGEIPVGAIQVGEIPMGEIPVGGISVGGVPIGGIPVGDMPVGGIPVGVPTRRALTPISIILSSMYLRSLLFY